jgi:hypothetical protein
MTFNSSYMKLAQRGDLDREREERRNKGRMPMDSLRCNRGTVIDLSPGGVCVERRSLRSWPVGKKTLLVFKFDGERLAVEAKVVRVTKAGMLRRRYGMQFIRVSPVQSRELMRLATTCRPQLSIAAVSVIKPG